ncbi:MAG TPA: FAD-dependent oxidoreductase [Gaiellaceae bacterium]|jgi:glycine/D-amino acid oxidase-like deaminating enzyme
MQRSLWLDEALAGEEDAPQLVGDVRADVCVCGGGYSGLWTAIRLKEHEPSLDVVLVEADVCGGGASGRNGGFVLSWWHKFASLQKVCGADEAVRLARACEAAVDEIGTFCSENAIDAHYRREGWLWTATSPVQIGAWAGTVAAIERACDVRPFVELSGDELAERSGSPAHLAGVYEAVSATVQPALLARGLRRAALERGVRIFERSRVTAFEPRVRTEHGSVAAETVAVSTGAWIGRNNRAVAVVASDVVATEPLDEPPLASGLSCSDSRLLVNYYRATRDGRLVFGTGGGALAFAGRVTDTFEGASPRAAEVESRLRAIYPRLAGARVVRSWTGPIERTMTGLPYFQRRGKLVYAGGYSGVGVCQTSLGGRILASLALERDDEWSRCGLVRGPYARFPPEPLRYVGGRVVRAAVARKEEREDAGRKPGWLTTRLAGFAPPVFVPAPRGSATSAR